MSIKASEIYQTKQAQKGHIWVADGRFVNDGSVFGYLPVMARTVHILKDGKLLFTDAFTVAVASLPDRALLAPYRENRGDVIVNMDVNSVISMVLEESVLLMDEAEAMRDLQERAKLPASAVDEEIVLATLAMLSTWQTSANGAGEAAKQNDAAPVA